MKRALPMVMKYLAIVGLSCFLAFFISHVIASAQTAAQTTTNAVTSAPAAIAFSPNARNKTNLARQFGDIKLPFFSITRSDDGSILDDGTRPEHRRLPYENMAPGQKYLVVFSGGDHIC